MFQGLDRREPGEPRVQKLFGEQLRAVHHALHNATLTVSGKGQIDFHPNVQQDDELLVSLTLRKGPYKNILVVTVEPKDEELRKELVYDIEDLEVQLLRVTADSQEPIDGIVLERFPNQMRFIGVEPNVDYVFSFPGGGDVRAVLPAPEPSPLQARAIPDPLSDLRGPAGYRERFRRGAELVTAAG